MAISNKNKVGFDFWNHWYLFSLADGGSSYHVQGIDYRQACAQKGSSDDFVISYEVFNSQLLKELYGY